MFLLDTNVVSELRRPRPHGAVLAWIGGLSHTQVFVSAVTIGELQAGVEITRELDTAKAAELERWIVQIAQMYNVLPMEGEIFRIWARLMHRRTRVLSEDAMIAATAEMHNLTVATRNVRDFAEFGVRTFDPFRPT